MSNVENLAHDVDKEEKIWVELIDSAHVLERISQAECFCGAAKRMKVEGEPASQIEELSWTYEGSSQHRARKRHNTKPQRWRKEKYFQVHEGRNWVFTGIVIGGE